MAGMIDLKKKVGIVLEKRKALTVKARVGCAIDVSGSTREYYERGLVQSVMERMLAVALQLDDNGSLDAWAFDTKVHDLPPMTAESYATYVQDAILDEGLVKNYGTHYAPPLRAALKAWYPKPGFLSLLTGAAARPAPPSLLLFATDGDNSDQQEAMAAMDEAAQTNLYIACLGIDDPLDPRPFTFLKREAGKRPNVGFYKVPDLRRLNDEVLFEELVTQEMADWLKQA